MDITFSCDNCCQSIVIDEAASGITVDCPKCGKPVYVPSSAPATRGGPPLRIETASARPVPVAAPISRVPSRPVEFAKTQARADVHPSIVASLRCLIIAIVLLTAGFVAFKQGEMLFIALFYMAIPFLGAALLCAVYGMCVGRVNQGLLLLAGISLIIGLSFWVSMRTMPSPTGIQREMEQQLRQFMH